jgi:hypothetical protein
MCLAAKPGEDLYLSKQVLSHLTIYDLIFLINLNGYLVPTNNVCGFADLSVPTNSKERLISFINLILLKVSRETT